MLGNEFNFIRSSDEKDKDLFFGPLSSEDAFLPIEESSIMVHLMFQAGLFKSVSEARRNGWNKPIPSGFSDMRVGKKKIRITILNIEG